MTLAHAVEVDGWLQDAVRPWSRLATIRMTSHESRRSLSDKWPDPVRKMTWLWGADPHGFLLAIESDMKPLTEAERKNQAYVNFWNLQYPWDWRNRTQALSNDRLDDLVGDTGVVNTRRVGKDPLITIGGRVITPLPLMPFGFLGKPPVDGFNITGLGLEHIRSAKWIEEKWALIEPKTVEQGPNRRVIRASDPPVSNEKGPNGEPPSRDAFEVVLERNAATGMPVIVSCRTLDPETGHIETYGYAAFKLRDGSMIPVCNHVELRWIEKNVVDDKPSGIADLDACEVDKPIKPEAFAVDLSQARKVFDEDATTEIDVDAGSR